MQLLRIRAVKIPRWLALAGALYLVIALLASLNLAERTVRQRMQVFDIEMSIAETGGFSPQNLRVQAGQPVTLRFHARDVTHAVAIGPGLGIDLGEIPTGEPSTITLIFEQPGVYTFYCNLWCSPEHWRMRGVVEVVDGAGRIPPPPADPVIAALASAGIDIDATHAHAEVMRSPGQAIPADTSALVDMEVPAVLRRAGWHRTHAPTDIVAILSDANPTRTSTDVAGAAAALWLDLVQPVNLPEAGNLYSKNCASCHGVTGQGDGMAAALAATTPAAFTGATLFDRRSDVLYAKIRRGGMGTGMPNFGTLFTPEETWGLVDYVWHLAYDAERSNAP